MGHSSPCEIKTYQALADSNGVSLGEEFPDDLINSYSDDDTSEVLEWSSLEFAPTYPCKPSYSTITLHNYRYMYALCVIPVLYPFHCTDSEA